ncbi:hypothetical protein DXG03_006366 [Asterophora parasitica]|uniref:Uncharacterized protein n=1 Tax=Asterophora parasitica TaxID=117018 RepID=A0A9P7K9K4_9AGAR|nr:hypothetical protein DXG03_006366 [Asterophora parasitica]
MTTTRRQEAPKEEGSVHSGSTKEEVGSKRDASGLGVTKTEEASQEESPTKKARTEESENKEGEENKGKTRKYARQTGTIERGHIYFFYRPKVMLEEVHSLDEVKNMHMLLVPRPPQFSTHTGARKSGKMDNEEDDTAEAEMEVLARGADAISATADLDTQGKHYRLITVGKKHLPDPEGGGPGKGRKETFWATVSDIGDDLRRLEQGLGEREYETKTRGTRHEDPARLAARGAYAIVNNDPEIPSKRATHFGYHISHPSEPGAVQEALGIGKAASFVLQVKNPLAPATDARQPRGKGAEYPIDVLRNVFGKGGAKGRESYGLRFASCEIPELLEYKGAQILLIAARGGEEGLETSLGEGRGIALEELEERESRETIETVFRELDVDTSVFPPEPLEGKWI